MILQPSSSRVKSVMSEVSDGSLLLLVAFLLANARNCHFSLVLASAVQDDADNCNTGLRRLRAAASSSALKDSQMLWPTGVGNFHSCLLTSLLGSRFPVQCAHSSHVARRRSSQIQAHARGQSTPASRFVDRAPSLEAGVQEVYGSDGLPSLLLLSVLDERIGSKLLYQSKSPLGIRWRSDRGLALFVTAWNVLLPTATLDALFGPAYRLSQKSWHSRSIFGVSAVGNLPTESPVRGQKHFQPALQEFQRFIGSLLVGTISLGGIIREGRCCDRRNFPRTRLSGIRLSWPKLAKATSELVPTLHLWEEKLAASFGSCNSPGC